MSTQVEEGDMTDHKCELPDPHDGGFSGPDGWTCPECGQRWERDYDESYDSESGEEWWYWYWVREEEL